MAGWNDLKDHLRIPSTITKDDDFISLCYSVAVEGVDQLIGLNTVPTNARNLAILEVGKTAFMKRQGKDTSSDVQGLAVANPRDIYSVAYPLLAPFMAVGL